RGRRQGDAACLCLGCTQHGSVAVHHHSADPRSLRSAAGLQWASDWACAVLCGHVRGRNGVVVGGAWLSDRVRRSERALRHRLCRHHHDRGDRLCGRSLAVACAQPAAGRAAGSDGVPAMKLVRAVGRFIARYYSIFLLLAAYEAMSRFGLVSPRLFPSLVVIAEQLWKYTANGDLVYQAGISLHRALLGFVLALIAGSLLGTA